MRISLTLILFILVNAGLGQKNDRLFSMTSVDFGLFSVALTHSPVLGKQFVTDLSLGVGPGYDVAEGSHVLKFLPATFFSVTPRYYYNREKRTAQGLKNHLNSGNFFGARVKYSLPIITDKNEIRNTLLMGVFWGIQRGLGKSWFFGTQTGVGYSLDVSNEAGFGTIYPHLDFRFGYSIGKKR